MALDERPSFEFVPTDGNSCRFEFVVDDKLPLAKRPTEGQLRALTNFAGKTMALLYPEWFEHATHVVATDLECGWEKALRAETRRRAYLFNASLRRELRDGREGEIGRFFVLCVPEAQFAVAHPYTDLRSEA